MTAPSNDRINNFWQGFAFGVASAVGVAYLIGTKPGREKLKKLMEYAEQYHGNTDGLFEAIDTMMTSPKNEEKEHAKAPDVKQDLSTLIDKVKSITQS